MDRNWASLALERRGLVDESKALSMTVGGRSPKVAKQIPRPYPRRPRSVHRTNHISYVPYLDVNIPARLSPHLLNMPPRSERLLSSPHLGGKSAVILFVVSIIAFVVESQLTQVRAPFYSIGSASHLIVYTVCAKHPSLSATILSLVRL